MAEIPGGIGPGYACIARAGVCRDEHQTELGSHALRSRLDCEGLFGAGQSGEIEQYGYPPDRGLRRHKDAELHRQADHARVMPIEALHATEAGMLAEDGDGANALHVSTSPPSGSTRRSSSARNP